MTDATLSNAEQWHIPPQATHLNNEISKLNSQPMPKIDDNLALLPQQPTVIATHVVDLTPVVAFFCEELQRLRDQLAVERTATSSAREALAACEARCKMLDSAGAQAVAEREHAVCDAREAQRMLVEERKNIARAQLEQAKTVPPGLVPGSVEAVLEAYRLLVGHGPEYSERTRWHDEDDAKIDGRLDRALAQLIRWLDEFAPGGRP